MRTLALQGKSRPLDYSFKVEKSIGGHGKQDKKFIKNYKKLFVVLNEEGTVVSWESTDFISQDKIEPVLNDVKFKLKNNQITYIYTDTGCSFSNVYEQYFPRVSIRLDLFHATQWITKVLADKKYWKAIDFSCCFGLIFRNSFDAEDIWNQITENPATTMRNIDDFMKPKDTYERAST